MTIVSNNCRGGYVRIDFAYGSGRSRQHCNRAGRKRNRSHHHHLVQWLRLFIETTGAIFVGVGVAITLYEFIRTFFPPHLVSYNRIRLTLARYLGLALESQLGADILSAAIAPSWDQIGKLAAIAIIRTVLNFFLTREMNEEREKSKTNESFPDQ